MLIKSFTARGCTRATRTETFSGVDLKFESLNEAYDMLIRGRDFPHIARYRPFDAGSNYHFVRRTREDIYLALHNGSSDNSS